MRQLGIERIRLEYPDASGFRSLDRRLNEGNRNAFLAIAFPYIETRDAPSRNVVQTFETSCPIKPGQCITRCKLTPTNR
jgi:hypothetical protein